ncbi:MAG: LD-carboxypeptidase [Oscillospiraceae bacterium]|nr:LD-carboxypeptidase [Oscillospiraceae bacterium]
MELIKPNRLCAGDVIATVSVSHGWAGDEDNAWRYELGKKHLEDSCELIVRPAPNSMRGSDYLSQNPQARAEDIMWAFENKDINAIIANVGGNDSIRILPFIDSAVIRNNPKIFIGMSDVMNINLLCLKAGLSTFYGPNLFTIAEAQEFHTYSKKWFKKALFDASPIGVIEPANDNMGYELIQGQGTVQGKLIGGHTGIVWLENEEIALSTEDFEEAILFIEDIPEFFSPKHLGDFLNRLGNNDFLQRLNGIVIGKLSGNISFEQHGAVIKNVVGNEYGLTNLPVLYGLNFGHISPICVLPYGATAEIDCEAKSFAILESGVI